MEALKETTKSNETIIRKVGNILCDCLKSLYGCRPCNFYKNQIAVLLVQSYPITAAESTETPQALWFHPHARGTNRHAGRIHYRMKYLSRKSEERVTKRRRIADQEEDVQLISPAAPEDIDKAESELKFIIPNSQMKSRVIELWNATFKMRHQYRIENQFIGYAADFPVITAYNGELLTMDFKIIHQKAAAFLDKWDILEPKISVRYHNLFKELKNGMQMRCQSMLGRNGPSHYDLVSNPADPTAPAGDRLFSWCHTAVL
ncbi:uncharacterized protein LOC135704016 [Ochlerotatus camptorhynchus]|uniref:uncharacterized protein LOC135704016 n=1 Tax=Ochlerotatus camptorhynchus TaxID=644619 RepID=UPI0031DE86F7